jgi:hypothetical protein
MSLSMDRDDALANTALLEKRSIAEMSKVPRGGVAVTHAP